MAIVTPLVQDTRDHPARIAIVGGGPGGLFTAWRIEEIASGPLSITIFEAADRLGGKLCTPSFSRAAIRYEAGAAELYDYEPVGDDPLRDLVRSLGLPTVPISGAAVHIAGREIANVDAVQHAFGQEASRLLSGFDTWARSAVTPREFYDSGSAHAADASPPGRFDAVVNAIGLSPVRRYIETMIHSDLATEPGSTTVGYGLQNYLMNDPAYMRLYRIAGGNEQIVTALVDRLAAHVRLGATVTEIRSEANGRLALTWRAGNGTMHEAFDVVIVALPIQPLEQIIFDDDALAEAMRRHIAHHDHPAHYLRITLLIDGPVPAVPGEDDYLMTDAFGGACLYMESGRQPDGRYGVLGWLLGGEAAATMAGLSDEALVAAAVEAIPSCLARCRDRVLEGRVHRWIRAVSAVPGGWNPLPVATRHRPSPGHPNIFVVGDYLYDSTLNGVLDSADYVAGWVAARLAGRSHPVVTDETTYILL